MTAPDRAPVALMLVRVIDLLEQATSKASTLRRSADRDALLGCLSAALLLVVDARKALVG